MPSTVLFSQTSHFIMRSSLCGFFSKWKRNVLHAGIVVNRLDFPLIRLHVQCYSTKRARSSRSPKVDPGMSIEDESNAFYVVRKGDVVGIYKTFDDCQAQVDTSVRDPPVSIYKGYSLSKDAEEHLASCGLKNAMYTIHERDIKEDLFGALMRCPFQQPSGLVPSPSKTSENASPSKRLKEMVELDNHVVSYNLTCVLEFDGASKGNPGRAGSGAILRTEDGSIVWQLREGLGVATNNAAEYRAIILGMKYALRKGFKKIRCQGDSKLVCMQMNNQWQVKTESLKALWMEAKELKDKFLSFELSHVRREFNSDADAQANLAVDLESGVICEDYDVGS